MTQREKFIVRGVFVARTASQFVEIFIADCNAEISRNFIQSAHAEFADCIRRTQMLLQYIQTGSRKAVEFVDEHFAKLFVDVVTVFKVDHNSHGAVEILRRFFLKERAKDAFFEFVIIDETIDAIKQFLAFADHPDCNDRRAELRRPSPIIANVFEYFNRLFAVCSVNRRDSFGQNVFEFVVEFRVDHFRRVKHAFDRKTIFGEHRIAFFVEIIVEISARHIAVGTPIEILENADEFFDVIRSKIPDKQTRIGRVFVRLQVSFDLLPKFKFYIAELTQIGESCQFNRLPFNRFLQCCNLFRRLRCRKSTTPILEECVCRRR